MLKWIVVFILLTTPVVAQRIVPTSDVTLYVAPAACANGYWPASPNIPVTVCGNDVTGNGTTGAPFATIQKAHDTFAALYDFQCQFRPTIQLAASSAGGGAPLYYSGLKISGRLVGQCGTVKPLVVGPGLPNFIIGKYLPYTLRGDPANVLGAFIYPGVDGRPAQPCISMSEAALKAEAFTCDATWAASDCIDVFGNSYLDIGIVWFGNCGYPGQSYSLHFGVAWNSAVFFTQQIWVTGSSVAFMQVAHSTVQGNSNTANDQVLISFMGTPVFRDGVFIVDHSVVYAHTLSFSGAVTGRKAYVLRNGALETNGHCNDGYIPGQPMLIQDNAVCR